MPKTLYVFRGGPKSGDIDEKTFRGRAPKYLTGEGKVLRPEYGERIVRARLGQTHLRSHHGDDCYQRMNDPEITNGSFSYIYLWTGVVIQS